MSECKSSVSERKPVIKIKTRVTKPLPVDTIKVMSIDPYKDTAFKAEPEPDSRRKKGSVHALG